MHTDMTQRQLEDDLVNMTEPTATQQTAQPDTTKSKRLEPKDATVYTAEGSAQVTDYFLLNACRLLAHH